MIRALVFAAIFTLPAIASAAPNGNPCTMSSDCDSGFCVDAVCCSTACSGQCEACDVAGSAGTCVPVVGSPHGLRTACDDSPTNACARSRCDGIDRTACKAFVGSDVTCRPRGCKDGVVTTEANCDGKGACPAGATASCGSYGCDDATLGCRTSCTESSHCASGNDCIDGKCVPPSAHCSADGLSSIAIDGRSVSCAPYRCVAGVCLASCAPGRDSDCREGLVCSGDGACVDPATLKKDDDEGGCAYAPRGSHGALALLVLAALGRFRAKRAT